MIHVFCGKRGSGKTKALINMANDSIQEAKGDVVYIDDDKRHKQHLPLLLELNHLPC